MRNTFRYSLTLQDYINYYQIQYKRIMKSSTKVIFAMFAFLALYYTFVYKDLIIAFGMIIAILFSACMMLINYKVIIKNNTKNMIKKSPRTYLRQIEITFTDREIETNNLPFENEAAFIAVYPYSIINAIIETDEYFVFNLGTVAKILPKRAIPPEMREQVFRQIRSNKNCTFLK